MLKGYNKGVNLGGWLSQGPKNKEHLETFITEDDIKTIAGWGLDHIRLPLDYEIVEDEFGREKESGYEYIQSCIEWCRKYGLNIVLDLHKTYGYVFDDKEYSKDFFYNESKQERFLELWRKLIIRFGRDADIIMFDILNEVVRTDVVEEWNQLSKKCIDLIHSYVPEAKILLGGVGYNALSAVKLLFTPEDDTVVYNFHCYAPLLFTHQSASWVDKMPSDFHIAYPGEIVDYINTSEELSGDQMGGIKEEVKELEKLGPEYFEINFQEAIKVAQERNVPLYCGEYGVIDQAPIEDTLNWFKDINYIFEKYNIGRAVWNYKEKDFGISGEHYAPVIGELVKYL